MDYPYAHLTDTQLQHVKEMESELQEMVGQKVILVVYESSPTHGQAQENG
jgi:hypothetical protein